MPAAFVALKLIIHAEPALAVQRVKQAVSEGGGVITNATRFSNKALSFHLEVEAKHLEDLRRALANAGQLASEGASRMQELAPGLMPEAEVLGLLHVTLVHEAPDERIELPKVPG